jgi:hypothetical protein
MQRGGLRRQAVGLLVTDGARSVGGWAKGPASSCMQELAWLPGHTHPAWHPHGELAAV